MVIKNCQWFISLNFSIKKRLSVVPSTVLHHFTYSGILSCVMPNDLWTTGVAPCPVGDVIDFVIDDDPSIVPLVVFGHFLIGIRVQPFSSFAHVGVHLLYTPPVLPKIRRLYIYCPYIMNTANYYISRSFEVYAVETLTK